jgi:uncharacterized repeat protein (TIGR02543 family)
MTKCSDFQQTPNAAQSKSFRHWLINGAAILTALLLGWSAGTANAAEYRAFWVDTWGTSILNQSQVDALLGVPGTSTAGQIRDANCNAVFIEVRRNCDACYPSSMGEPYMSGLTPSNFNALQAAINAAHDTTGGKKRIEVHCWIVTFRTSGGTVYSAHSSTPTGSLTTLDNYWPSRDDAGAEVSDKAFDPGHPLALQYTVNVAMDLVNNFDIDGIHYDYIRFTANNQGYNPTSIARYNARYGLTGQPAASNEQFKQWRRDQVSALVRQVYARVQKSKPSVKQSGSFVTWNPSPTTSTRAGFQATRPYYDVYSDWDSWMQEGIVDMAVPMTYYNWASLPTDYTKWMNFEKDRKFNRQMIIGPGIYLNSLANAISEILMTRDASPSGNYAQGFCGYSQRTPYASGTWSGFSPSLVSQVTPTWDDIPDMPWKSSPTKGHMMGTVTIAGTGAWADGATVSITGPASRTQTNDGTGFYAFIDLSPGNYTVTVSKSGYPNATGTVNVAIGAVTGNMYEQNLVLGGSVAPSITTQPQSQSVGQGANATFTVTATGTAPLSYQWRLYGTNIGGATALSYTRPTVQPADAGPYSVVVTNAAGNVTSSNATLTVETTVTPPAIASQPLSQTVIAGQSATFSVTAAGTAPLSYQWRFNTVPIAGATGSACTRASIQTADAGSYSVVVTNSAGSTNSTDAVLTVNFSLTASTTAGGTVSKSPDQASYAPNAVVNLTAAANTNYLFTGWSGDASGTNNPLSVTMTTNKSVSATFVSTATEIIIDNTDPGWTNTSPSGSWTAGSTAGVPKIGSNYLYTAGTGGSSITRSCRWTPAIPTVGFYDVYVYYQIGANRTAGATYKVFYNGGNVSSLQNQYSTTPNQGDWFLVGSNLLFAAGTGGHVELGNDAVDTALVSADAAKFVLVAPLTPPSITGQPQPGTQSVNAGQSATFTVSATGTAPLSYQWRLNGTNIAGATGSGYTRNNAQPADAGSYSVTVTNVAGSVTSSNAQLTVNVPPAITTQPQGLTVNQGSDAAFTVLANGTAPLAYQWYFGGLPIAGATGSQFTVTNAQPGVEGNYSVEVLNVAGQVTSSNAWLTVNVPPTITDQPQSLTAVAGSNVTFTVTATGTLPLSYQWRFNGTNIHYTTASAYTCNNAQSKDAGSYSVVVSNIAGALASADAVLSVSQPSPPRIDWIGLLPDGQIQLQVSGIPGHYAIEGTTNLLDWAELTNFTTATNQFEYLDPRTDLSPRFYRARLLW